ncbi:ATP-binding protein, partial [Streptomyces sp. SID7982]|nr:ATP-binding protein [Streptomyces sp. SID7982]
RRVSGRAVLGGARRNLAAAGAGALLIAVLGTVVTLGVTSDGDEPDSRNVTTEQTATEDPADDGLPTDETDDGSSPSGAATDETSAAPSAS